MDTHHADLFTQMDNYGKFPYCISIIALDRSIDRQLALHVS